MILETAALLDYDLSKPYHAFSDEHRWPWRDPIRSDMSRVIWTQTFFSA